MPRVATVKVELQNGARLSFLNAQAEEGNGRLMIFRTRDSGWEDSTATILASLDSNRIRNWKIEQTESGY